MNLELKEIAHVVSPFAEKFGVPRQSGLCNCVKSKIVFEPEFSDRNAFRLLETYTHVWLLWGFSEVYGKDWSPTVRPPKMGGNARAGVFATRSPFRPNPLAMSAVKLDGISFENDHAVLTVSGADLMNGTPIYDVKPYVPYADSIPDASAGISSDSSKCSTAVEFLCPVDDSLKAQLEEVLAQDPHPLYQNDENRVYKMTFASKTVAFKAYDKQIKVLEIS